MKLKKFFAGVLAAAMMLTVGATAAFATAASGDAINNGGNFTIPKNLTANETGMTVPSDTVNFTIIAENDAAKTTGLALPTITSANVNNGTGNIAVSLPTYSKVGEYVYTITESEGNVAGVNYSTATYKMHVYVVNSDADNTQGSVLQCKVRFDKVTTGENGETTDKKISSIENTYDAGTLTVTKKVTGSMGDRDQAFSFDVTFTAPTGKILKSEVTVGGTAEAVTAGTGCTYADGKITFAENATPATVSFTLTDSDSIVFTNVPNGVTYTVSEAKFGDYTTKVGLDNAAATSVAVNDDNKIVSSGTFSVSAQKSALSVNYINNNGALVDTGVILDNAPYIALLAIVAIGGVALMLNKRRRDEE